MPSSGPQKKKRGLAKANPRVREEVSILGGLAEHPRGRGLANADPELRRQISIKGWKASVNKRRLRKLLGEIL